jgi:hypothetical protein
MVVLGSPPLDHLVRTILVATGGHTLAVARLLDLSDASSAAGRTMPTPFWVAVGLGW